MRARLGGCALLTIGLLAVAPARAGNWPHWRGPEATGQSEETGLPVSWSDSENIAWRIELPAVSGSTPIIWEDQVFLNVGHGDDLTLWSIDRRNGDVEWRRPLGGDNHVTRKQNMSSPSPVTDGERVWVLTGTGVVAAFDLAGTELWRRDVQADYGRFGLNWGYASSPLLVGDALIVEVLHGMKTDEPSYVLALNASNGETNWRVERPTDARMEAPDAYTTPAVVQTEDGPQIVVSGGGYVTGHDPATGREIWRGGGLNPKDNPMYRVIASPVVSRDMIYEATRVTPFLAFRAGGSGDISQSHLVFAIERNGPDVPTPATDGKTLYLLNDRGALSAYDARTGEELWANQRLARGTYSASPLLVEGRIYATNEAGTTTVARVEPRFEILSENELDGYTLASIAVSQGQLFIRNDKHLFCIGVE